jgi:hypothetical protein
MHEHSKHGGVGLCDLLQIMTAGPASTNGMHQSRDGLQF